MKNDYDKVKSSRNELEAILRIRGISKLQFGRILNIKGSTIDKYIDCPYMIRYYHMLRLAKFLNVDVKDIIDIIEVDLKDSFDIDGEQNYVEIDYLTKNKNGQV